MGLYRPRHVSGRALLQLKLTAYGRDINEYKNNAFIAVFIAKILLFFKT